MGAGKSSIGGAMIRAAGADYFNPDEAARQILDANPGATIAEANSAAWLEGKRLLEHAIAEHGNFATTLGGATITKLLAKVMDAGIDVHVWYVALDSPELHIARVHARVSRGGSRHPRTRNPAALRRSPAQPDRATAPPRLLACLLQQQRRQSRGSCRSDAGTSATHGTRARRAPL
jgi:hypothetical protein